MLCLVQSGRLSTGNFHDFAKKPEICDNPVDQSLSMEPRTVLTDWSTDFGLFCNIVHIPVYVYRCLVLEEVVYQCDLNFSGDF